MQPYFFPNLAHFALIAHCDRWVVFDIAQLTKKSWVTRNRVIHPSSSWKYVSVPITKCNLETKIFDAAISNVELFHEKTRNSLDAYRNKAPFYENVIDLVDKVFLSLPDSKLLSLNLASIKQVCSLLNIRFAYELSSELPLNLSKRIGPGEWAPVICGIVGAQTYLNPLGGQHLFNKADFSVNGVSLEFLEYSDQLYNVGEFDFIPGLSVLDALMWNSPALVAKMLIENSKIVRCGTD
jgi:hypothetical protein